MSRRLGIATVRQVHARPLLVDPYMILHSVRIHRGSELLALNGLGGYTTHLLVIYSLAFSFCLLWTFDEALIASLRRHERGDYRLFSHGESRITQDRGPIHVHRVKFPR